MHNTLSKAPTLSLQVKRKVSCRTLVLRWRPKIPLSNLVLPSVNTQCRSLVERGGMFHLAGDPLEHSLLVTQPAMSIKARSQCRLTTNLNELSRRTSRSLRSHLQPLLQIRRSSLPSLPPPPEGIQVVVLLHPGVQVNQEEAQLGEEREGRQVDKGDEVQASFPSHAVEAQVEQGLQLARRQEVLPLIRSRRRRRIHLNPLQGHHRVRRSLLAWRPCGKARNRFGKHSTPDLKLMAMNG